MSEGKIYVDEIKLYSPEQVPAHARHCGNQWAHLWADDIADLHEFADVLNLKRSWFLDRPGFPHYDVTPDKQRLAIKLGAQLSSLRQRQNSHRDAEVQRTN